MLTINQFRSLGQEQKYVKCFPPLRWFIALFGSIGIHSRIRAGHVLKMVQKLHLPSDAYILDAGCGHALALFWLARRCPNYTCHGLEVDADLVKHNQQIVHALRMSNVQFEQADLAQITLETGAYDLVISIDVLEHIDDDIHVLTMLRQALKPKGKLILHLPLRHQLQRRIIPVFKQHIVHDHVRDEYLPDEIVGKLFRAGFETLAIHYGFSWRGELAFEFNNLFWNISFLRALASLLMYPFAWLLAYWDIATEFPQGNSLIVLAAPLHLER